MSSFIVLDFNVPRDNHIHSNRSSTQQATYENVNVSNLSLAANAATANFWLTSAGRPHWPRQEFRFDAVVSQTFDAVVEAMLLMGAPQGCACSQLAAAAVMAGAGLSVTGYMQNNRNHDP